MSDVDISLVPTHVLVDEILNRADHGIVTTLKTMTKDTTVVTRRWVGNTHAVVGLAVDAQRAILNTHHEEVTDLDDTERDDLS